MSSEENSETDEQRLERLLAAAEPIEDEAADLQHVREAIKQADPNNVVFLFDDMAELSSNEGKWAAIREYISARPLRQDAKLGRMQMWQELADRFGVLGDRELQRWLLMRIAMPHHLEKSPGSEEMVRCNRLCYLVLLDHVSEKVRALQKDMAREARYGDMDW